MKPRASIARSLPPVYAAAAVRVAFPLLVLPVMAARLGVEEFGRLGLCLVWAALLSLLVEGGFMAAATRHAVTADAHARRRLARQVFSARCVLSVPVGLLAFTVGAWVIPGSAIETDQMSVAVLLALLSFGLGWPAIWHLQATSQLHRWALVELGVLGVLLVACLGWVTSLTSYLFAQVLAQAMLAGASWVWLRRDLDFRERNGLWSRTEVAPGLALGGTMLPVSLVGSTYNLALPAIAASQLGPVELGVYYLVDRVVRALLSASDPMVQLVYPRIVDRMSKGVRAALLYASKWAFGGLFAGLVAAYAVMSLWPTLQGHFGGDIDSGQLKQVISVAAWLLPLGMAWRFIAYWMLGSRRYDAAYRSCVVVGAIVGLTGAWAFGGSAAALAGVGVAAELAVIATAIVGMLLTEWRHRR